MSRLRTLFVFGTRPEAIKLAPLVREFRRRRDVFRTRICVTAQHREMLDAVLRVFAIKPDHDLDIMRPGQTLFDVTGRALTRLEPVLETERPDVLLVQGDTTTAMVAALAAFYQRIPVAHVEAGLRTYDLQQPFPEELNRRLISPLAEFNFAPTPAAARNLFAERIPRAKVFVTGNPVIDALRQVTSRRASGVGRHPRPAARRMILVTAHRRENFGTPLENICRALRTLAETEPDLEIVYPVHPNPNVRVPVEQRLGAVPNIRLLPPLDYLPFADLMRQCYLILSDSGGIQEEAPALGKPVLVLRDKTERPEAIRAGTAKLVGTDPERILRAARRLLHSRAAYDRMARARNPFGDGRAAERTADFLEYRLGTRRTAPRPFTPSGGGD